MSYPSFMVVRGRKPPFVLKLKNGTRNRGNEKEGSSPNRNVLYPLNWPLYCISKPADALTANCSPPRNAFRFRHPMVIFEPVRLFDFVFPFNSKRSDFLGNRVR